MKKILLIRLDKIGDLVCTMCVDQIPELQHYQVEWAIAKGLHFIPENAEPKRKFITLDKRDRATSIKLLRAYLRAYKPDIAVSFQAPWWVHYALWREKITVRAGVKSQWHSFLFLNKGIRQKRSLASKHESQYNVDLLYCALNLNPPATPAPLLKLNAPLGFEPLKTHNLEPRKYVVVHPGMAGSALNWPTAHYIRLIESLSPEKVIVTGTPPDEHWIVDIREHFKNSSHVTILQNKLSSIELLSILKEARAVIAPSTGVAHMASSLGTQVLGLYSPMRVQHPIRWAARGSNVHIFVPSVSDINNVNPDIMHDISPEEVLKVLREIPHG